MSLSQHFARCCVPHNSVRKLAEMPSSLRKSSLVPRPKVALAEGKWYNVGQDATRSERHRQVGAKQFGLANARELRGVD